MTLITLPPLGRIDLEPDVFSYSFNGRGGQFFYSPQQGRFYTIPYSRLLIEKVAAAEGGSNFVITDEAGYKYFFGLKTKTSFSTSSASTDNNATYDGQWYLTEVQAPDGNIEFQFEYVSNNIAFDAVSTSQTRQYLQNMIGGICGSFSGNQMPVDVRESFDHYDQL